MLLVKACVFPTQNNAALRTSRNPMIEFAKTCLICSKCISNYSSSVSLRLQTNGLEKWTAAALINIVPDNPAIVVVALHVLYHHQRDASRLFIDEIRRGNTNFQTFLTHPFCE